MKQHKTLVAAAIALSMIASVNVRADDQQCATNVTSLAAKQPYKTLGNQLKGANFKSLTQALRATSDEGSYQQLLSLATTIAAGAGSNGRLVVTLPDGTVVVDTGKNNNSYANFQAKAINENHNSRIAILDSQLWPCGIGVESKLSTTTGTNQNYFAKRMGAYLKSAGTARISD